MSADPIHAVSGYVLMRERVALPPGAVLTAKLIDNRGNVLAGTAVAVLTVPAKFTLYADPADVAAARKLQLWARLRSDAGVWGTTDLVNVAEDGTEIVVTRIDT